MERLAYLHNARHAFPNGIPIAKAGIKKGNEANRAIENAKLEFSIQAKNTLKLSLNMADGGGTGGNSDTGNTVPSRFSPLLRQQHLVD